MDLRVGVPGLIKNGRWAGQTIRIEDQRAETGGYLILVGPDAAGEQTGDIWVEASQLSKAFDQTGWNVDWRDDDKPGGKQNET